MANLKITKRDHMAIEKLASKVDALAKKYAEKYGETYYGECESDVANLLFQASASLEELLENLYYNN